MFSCLEIVCLFWILTVDGVTTSAQHLTAGQEGIKINTSNNFISVSFLFTLIVFYIFLFLLSVAGLKTLFMVTFLKFVHKVSVS